MPITRSVLAAQTAHEVRPRSHREERPPVTLGGAGAAGFPPRPPSRARWLTLSLTPVHEVHVDQKNKVVTTPAFMCETALHHIHDGIGAMVAKVLELARK